jgi:type IV pilus assembly protein PilM
VDTLAIELVRAIQFFFSSSAQTQIDHVFLGGGCARIQGLADAVQRRTNVNTSIANPFLNMTLSNDARSVQADAPALLIACGLALRRFEGVKT